MPHDVKVLQGATRRPSLRFWPKQLRHIIFCAEILRFLFTVTCPAGAVSLGLTYAAFDFLLYFLVFALLDEML